MDGSVKENDSLIWRGENEPLGVPYKEHKMQLEGLLAKARKACEISKTRGVFRQTEAVVKYKCSLCKDTGGKSVVSGPNIRHWKRCECQVEHILKIKAKAAGIPEEFLSLELPLVDDIATYAYTDVSKQSVTQIDINKFLEQYTKDVPLQVRKRRNILLYGNNGSGKTSTSMVIALKALKAGLGVQYTTMRRYINQKLNYSNEDAVNEAERMREVDVLILDDVGKEFHPNAMSRTLMEIEELLRYRFTRNALTILTSNFSPFEWTETEETLNVTIQNSVLSLMRANCLVMAMIIENDYRNEMGKKLWEGMDISSMEVNTQ